MGYSTGNVSGSGGILAAYAVLGVPPRASQDEVRNAYRELLRRFHPDTNGGDRTAEERLRAVQEAYERIGRAHAAKGARETARASAQPAQASRSFADVVRAELRDAYRAGYPAPGPRVLDIRVS